MSKHEEFREKLDKINYMERGEASVIVTDILKYLMDSIKPDENEELRDARPKP